MMQIESVRRWLSRSVVALAVSAVYVYGYPAAKISYVLVDLFHIAIGIVLTLFLAFYLFRLLPRETLLARLGWILLLAGALLGIVLIKIGTPLRLKPWLYAHIASCVLGALFLATSWLRSKAWLGDGLIRRGLGFAALALLTAGIAAGTWWVRRPPGKTPIVFPIRSCLPSPWMPKEMDRKENSSPAPRRLNKASISRPNTS